MKRQIILIIASCMLLLVCGLGSEIDSSIKLSHESGFYDDDFYLEILAPTKEIYYTLDGSEPNRDSIKYEEPIYIADASSNENLYANLENVSTRLLKDLIEEHSELEYNPPFAVSESNVDKGTMLRVVYYDVCNQVSKIENAIYFVGFLNKDVYTSYKTMSIITNPDNLFDDKIGIYVNGETFESYLENNIKTGDYRQEYWWWDANYHQSGKEWERPANIILFNEESTNVLNKDVGIRIQGNSSRTMYPKSLNIYSRIEYDETRDMGIALWDNSVYVPDNFTLSSSGQDIYTKSYDRLAAELCQNLNVSTFNFELYNMFLNGEYWGTYHIAEKYTENYFKHYYNIDSNQLVFFKGGEIEIGTGADSAEAINLRDFTRSTDFTVDSNYEYLWTEFDKESTIDYFALMIYFARTGDWWPMGDNNGLWKSRDIIDNQYQDGKWRWVVYDMNSSSFNEARSNHDTINDVRKRIPWFDALCYNEDFTAILSKRLYELLDKEFNESAILTLIDNYVAESEDAMELHYNRFFDGDFDMFYTRIESMRDFFIGRDENIKNHIYNNFGYTYEDLFE